MKMRGVRNDATMTSHAFRGIFQNKEEKEEYYDSNQKTCFRFCILDTEKLNTDSISKKLWMMEGKLHIFQRKVGLVLLGMQLNSQ